MLSSIDFGADVTSAIKIARYLETQGLKKDALAIYRDAHRASPSERLPLEAGLQLSLELEDRDGVVWASTGILSQSWNDEHVPLIEKAILAAEAAYIRLSNEGRKMEAFALKQAVEQARLRDIVVRVSWTGNADIDLAVEEPIGTICNATNSQTIAGGLMLGGDASSLDKPAKDGFSETYACAQGFAGQYKIVVRKVWGNVAGGKVTVRIITDYLTKEQRVTEHQVSVDRDAVIIAEVKNGHRKEPLVEAQLAKVQAEKSFASNSVLAQTAPDASQPSESESASNWNYQQLLYRYANRNSNRSGNSNVLPPFFRGGAVGYRPNIVVIPSGTIMVATAVISGDRKYVRVSAAPQFNDIIAVDTFNFVNGAGTNNGGGAGGGGAGGGGAGGGGGGGGFGGGGAF